MNSVYNRPQSNPNRWMVTRVPVMEPKPKVDWLSVIGFAVLIGVAIGLLVAMPVA